MTRTFFAYPGGAAGAALFLLRASAATLLAAVILGYPLLSIPWAPIASLLCLALVAGYKTRFAGALCAVIALSFLVLFPSFPVLLVITHVMDAIALILLGPGALSLDARFYGRRVVTSQK